MLCSCDIYVYTCTNVRRNLFTLILPCSLPLIFPRVILSLSSVSLSRRKEADVLDGPEGTLNNTEITLLFSSPPSLWQHSFVLLLPHHYGLLQSLTFLFFHSPCFSGQAPEFGKDGQNDLHSDDEGLWSIDRQRMWISKVSNEKDSKTKMCLWRWDISVFMYGFCIE